MLVGKFIYMALGLLSQLASFKWPFRRFAKPRVPWLDFMAYAWVLVAELVTAELTTPVGEWIARHAPALSSASSWLSTHLPWPIALLLFLAAVDFCQYWMHRLMHSRWVWNHHALHHSVENMYWLAGLRASPVHVLLFALPFVFLDLVLPLPGLAAPVGGIMAMSVQHLIHSNLSWRFGPLEWLLVTPRYHLVHHAADPKLNGSNFGLIFTVWDRMFGTYTAPEAAGSDFPLGLNYPIGLSRLFFGLPPASGDSGAPVTVLRDLGGK